MFRRSVTPAERWHQLPLGGAPLIPTMAASRQRDRYSRRRPSALSGSKSVMRTASPRLGPELLGRPGAQRNLVVGQGGQRFSSGARAMGHPSGGRGEVEYGIPRPPTAIVLAR